MNEDGSYGYDGNNDMGRVGSALNVMSAQGGARVPYAVADRIRRTGMAGMRGMGAFAYEPNLSPVGSLADGTYYPGDTADDASALHYLGYYDDRSFADHVGTLGSPEEDEAAGVGAWDSTFGSAVAHFQGDNGLIVDYWINLDVRRALAAAVDARMSQDDYHGGDMPLPDDLGNRDPVYVDPNSGPAPPPLRTPSNLHNASTMSPGMKVAAVVGGGLLLVIGGYYLMK